MEKAEQTLPPGAYINRELSWLEFNQRVLDEATDPKTPLMEQVKFLAIVSSNLDEFFEVRVAGIKQQIESNIAERGQDGLTPREVFKAIYKRVRRFVAEKYRCWREQAVPALATNGIRFVNFNRINKADRAWIDAYYQTKVRPVLTPLGIDPAHPFPQLLNKSLNIIVSLEAPEHGARRKRLAVVQVPRAMPRLVRLPRDNASQAYIFLGVLICHYLADLFPGAKILGSWQFRVTRNSELYIDVEDTTNLLRAVEDELHNRRRGDAVRLEIESACPAAIRDELLQTLSITKEDVYIIDGPLDLTRLLTIIDDNHSPELRDPPFVAPHSAALREQTDLFAAIRERDILLHHPYESFNTVVEFLEIAAQDPKVLAIKQTLYRTGGDPRIVGALMNAVKNGKQVTAVVELKARFDEANNIQWSRRLEEAGVHVVYGLVGYKVHAKMALVVRQDEDGIRRYLHVGTGNYNPNTARIYTDIGLLTCKPDFGEDAHNLFNLLTGICQFQGARKFLIAPFELHDRMVAMVRRETENATKGLPARIIAKMNALVDPEIIAALYEASRAGVKVDLIVRGICCLRPQVKGLSENITVRSIVDRFLEHSRIFYFENACQPEVYVGSADWMPRNFFCRVEVVFPLDDGNLREQIYTDILAATLADNVKARILQADGSYRSAAQTSADKPSRSQAEFIRRSLNGHGAPYTASTPKTKYPRVKVRVTPDK